MQEAEDLGITVVEHITDPAEKERILALNKERLDGFMFYQALLESGLKGIHLNPTTVPVVGTLQPIAHKLSEEERAARRARNRQKAARAAERRSGASKGKQTWIGQAKEKRRVRDGT